MKKGSIEIILIFILIVLFLYLFPNLNSNHIKKGKLYINEILASNNKTLEDNYQEYSDYIELYNGYNISINLSDYYLSDNEYETDKWKFPDIEIKPHEYLIVYASGKNKCDIEKRICHTNFKLSSAGETLALSDKVGNIISKISFLKQYPDISYGYKKGKYIYFRNPTPGYKNNSEEYIVNTKEKYQLEITEYMTHNKRSINDKYGNYFDFMEIYNPTTKDYTLEGIYVTDNPMKLKKYLLPKTIIKSREYIVIYFAGSKVDYEDGIYADFSLSDKDEYLIISNGNKIFDKVKVVSLSGNISYGKVENEWKYFTTPTPGKENNTAYFDKIGDDNGSS